MYQSPYCYNYSNPLLYGFNVPFNGLILFKLSTELTVTGLCYVRAKAPPVELNTKLNAMHPLELHTTVDHHSEMDTIEQKPTNWSRWWCLKPAQPGLAQRWQLTATANQYYVSHFARIMSRDLEQGHGVLYTAIIRDWSASWVVVGRDYDKLGCSSKG